MSQIEGNGLHRNDGQRSKAAIEAERNELRERTEREIDQLADKFKLDQTESGNLPIGAIYARYIARVFNSRLLIKSGRTTPKKGQR